jgi:long-chain acyl-CoA synthetase
LSPPEATKQKSYRIVCLAISLVDESFDFEEGFEDVNARLDPHEQLHTLVVIKTPWTVANGFITPTFKIKRNRIEEAYGAKFEGWVGKRAKLVLGD